MIGWTEILIIVIFALILFGTGRIPTIMEDVAKGIKAFKKGLKDVSDDINADDDAPASKKSAVKKTPKKAAGKPISKTARAKKK